MYRNSINDATPYAAKVPTAEPNIFIDGIPVSKEKDHGIGSQSIVYTVEKLHGHYQFFTKNHHFILRIVI